MKVSTFSPLEWLSIFLHAVSLPFVRTEFFDSLEISLWDHQIAGNHKNQKFIFIDNRKWSSDALLCSMS